MKFLAPFFLCAVALAGTAFAQETEVCADHDGIPIYCDFPARTRLELSHELLKKYVSFVAASFNPAIVWDYLACFDGWGAKCPVGEAWLNGPLLPIPTESEVMAKIHFSAVVSCVALPGSKCAQGHKPDILGRFELVADSILVDSFTFGAPELIFKQKDGMTVEYELNIQKSEEYPGYFSKYLNGVIPAGAIASVRFIPLATTTNIKLKHIKLTTVQK